MGIPDADSAEHATGSRNLVIAPVSCPVSGRTGGAPKLSGACRLRIQPGCRLAAIYRAKEADEEYFCNYEVNRQYLQDFEHAGLRLTAFDENGDLRAVELPDHRFFLATLFQPQLSSAEGRPHPLIAEFLAAAISSNSGSRHGV
jgi:CTP synthase (UTP-ammonia lyase)